MLTEMFSNIIAMWSYIIIATITFIFLIGMILYEFGVFQRIGEYIRSIKNRYLKYTNKINNELNFNPYIIIFGGIAIFMFFLFGGLRDWIKRNRHRITMTIINIVMNVPIILLVFGFVEKLPESFTVFYIFYLFMLIIVVMARTENKRNGYSYNDGGNYTKYPNNDYSYGYKGTTYTYKPKPKGISQEEAKIKKEKIRETLLKNKELKKKYNL